MVNKNKIGYGFKKYYTEEALKKYDTSQSNKYWGNLIRVFLFCGLNILLFTLYYIYIKYDDEMNIINNEEDENKKNILTIELLTSIFYYFIISISFFIFLNYLFSIEYNDNHILISFGKFFNYFKKHIYILTFLILIYISLFSSLSFTHIYFNIFNNNLQLKKNMLIFFNVISLLIFISYLFTIVYTSFNSYTYKPIFFSRNYKNIFKI